MTAGNVLLYTLVLLVNNVNRLNGQDLALHIISLLSTIMSLCDTNKLVLTIKVVTFYSSLLLSSSKGLQISYLWLNESLLDSSSCKLWTICINYINVTCIILKTPQYVPSNGPTGLLKWLHVDLREIRELWRGRSLYC